MTQNVPFQMNNAAFNPLFAEMQKRFSHNSKTIAEIMLERADAFERSSSGKTPVAEYHMTRANSLPKAEKVTTKKKRKCFFTLSHAITACMTLLVVGTLFFAGATIGSVKDALLAAPAPMSEAGVEGNLSAEIPFEAEACGFEGISSDDMSNTI